MEKAILDLWAYIQSYWSEEEIIDFCIDYGVDGALINERDLSELYEEDIEELMVSLISILEDIAGLDNQGELFDTLQEATSLSAEQIEELLDL